MNKQISLSEIPKDLQFEGYIWMSDSENPKMFKHENLCTPLFENASDNNNPFIIEGQLFAAEAQKSYSIKYVDGKHLVVEYDLSQPLPDFTDTQFIPNRLKDVDKINFRQYWKAETDAYCVNMETLKPACYVFVGFDYSSNEVKEEK